MSDVMLRLNRIGSDKNVDLSIWGWGYAYSREWKVKITLTSQGDKHELVGTGESMFDAAEAALRKYDMVVKALPDFDPNLAIEHKADEDVGF